MKIIGEWINKLYSFPQYVCISGRTVGGHIYFSNDMIQPSTCKTYEGVKPSSYEFTP